MPCLPVPSHWEKMDSTPAAVPVEHVLAGIARVSLQSNPISSILRNNLSKNPDEKARKSIVTRHDQFKRHTNKVLHTNVWVNQMVQEDVPEHDRVFKFNHRHVERFHRENPPPAWHDKLAAVVRETIETRYPPPFSASVMPVNLSQFELPYWIKRAFPQMDEITGRYLTQKFAKKALRAELHAMIDKASHPSLLPTAYNATGVEEKDVEYLEHTVKKVRYLGLLRQNLVKVPDNDWKPYAFSYYKKNLLQDFWVEDPLASVIWLPSGPEHLTAAANSGDSVARSPLRPQTDRSMIDMTERSPRIVRHNEPTEEPSEKKSPVDTYHRTMETFLVERLKGASPLKRVYDNRIGKDVLVVRSGKRFTVNKQATVPAGLSCLGDIRRTLNIRSQRRCKKLLARRWTAYPKEQKFRFAAKKEFQQDDTQPDAQTITPNGATAETGIASFPEVTSVDYWKRVLMEWAWALGYLPKMLENYPVNPQPVEVISQMATVSGMERLRGVLASLLPQPPSIDRAHGFFLLISRVSKQVDHWNRAFEEMLRVIECLASEDTFLPVRQAATIITCARQQQPSALDRTLWEMLRSSLLVNRWIACQLLPLTGHCGPEVLREILSLLYDFVQTELQRTQLIQMLLKFPTELSIVVEEICSRLNSGRAAGRQLSCRIIPVLLETFKDKLVNFDRIRGNVLKLAFSDDVPEVLSAAADCLSQCGWEGGIFQHFLKLFRGKPDDLADKIKVLRQLEHFGRTVPDVFETLVDYLGDSLSSVRCAALQVIPKLAILTPESFRWCLRAAMTDDVAKVRMDALTALQNFASIKPFATMAFHCFFHIIKFENCIGMKQKAADIVFACGSQDDLVALHTTACEIVLVERDAGCLRFLDDTAQKVEKLFPDLAKRRQTSSAETSVTQDAYIKQLHAERDPLQLAKMRYMKDNQSAAKQGAWRSLPGFSSFYSH